uniref:Uncharacterized protein n=1 Tax=Latimeria chalumnae TaxID=7897 RepID=H3A4G0_LATCH
AHYVPHNNVSLLFYKRRFCYSLAVHNMGTSEVHCYMWHEGEAKRRVCETGSCLYEYITNILPDEITEVSMFSDSCGGQNRNQFFAAVCQHTVTNPNGRVELLDHKFLEKGHTEMEGGSMHSAIENAAKKNEICHPYKWHSVARLARKKGSLYIFKHMKQ